MRSLKKSNAHFRKALGKLPLGVASNFRYWGDDKTIYVQRGKGARIWDKSVSSEAWRWPQRQASGCQGPFSKCT